MTTVRLTTPVEQARGVIGRYPAPGERYVFEFETVESRLIHMVGVRQPLRVEWYVNGQLEAAKTLRPWIGWGRARADCVVERRPS